MIPTSTKISIAVKTQLTGDWQTSVIFLTDGAKPADGASAAAVIDEDASKAVARLFHAGAAHGKSNEVVFELIENKNHIRRVYVAGLGKREKLTTETLRQSAAAIAKALSKHKQSGAALVLPMLEKISAADAADAIVTGFMLASFDDRQYKGTAHKDEEERPAQGARTATLICPAAQLKAVTAAVQRAQVIAEAQNFCRTIANRAGNDVDPPELAKIARDLARQARLKCTILDERQMERLGMGGILAVGAGSIASPPRMIVLEHGPKSGKPILVVGKAITFDTGGISIKPADKMGKMIFDKCGGIAVLGLMYAVAKLKLPIRLVGILASAENAISSKAYRPGDVLRMYNGVTVEVTNTDAEGRLVLGDALAWGIEKFRPLAAIDLATLTGGVIVALGRTIAGIMGNNDDLVNKLISAGESAGEKLWRLPLGQEQRDQIKSEPADIVNSAGREGHPLQGGAFISYFVPQDNSVPWAHLDIAGVADTEKDLPYYAKGATGWGVRTLVNWVSGLPKPSASR